MATSFDWFKESKPIIMTVVVGLVTYFGVDRHAQEQKDKEQKLQEIKVRAEIEKQSLDRADTLRKGYLSKAIDTDDNKIRLRYLRYLTYTETDKNFRNWAKDELGIVEKQLDQVTKERDEALAQVKELSEKVVEAEKKFKLAEVEAENAKEKLQVAQTTEEKSVARKVLADAEIAALEAKKSVNVSRVQLKSAEVKAQVKSLYSQFICEFEKDGAKNKPLYIDANDEDQARRICTQLLGAYCAGGKCIITNLELIEEYL